MRVSFPLCVLALALALVLAFAVSPLSVAGRSSGLLGSCDLTPKLWPPKTVEFNRQQLWPNGLIGGNRSALPNWAGSYFLAAKDNTMWWASCPVPSPKYTLRAGDADPSADLTSYLPGETIELTLRVLNYRMAYIGLVMYATNVHGAKINNDTWQTETQVGTWRVMPRDPVQVTPTCPSAVTHTTADLKPLRLRFYWSAPQGTGTVRFRVLIKQGEQNTGAFYYPVKELRLTERVGSVPTSGQKAILGAPGVACADVCKTQPTRPYCNGWSMLNKAGTAADLAALLKNNVASRAALVAGCAYQGPPQISVDGHTSFRAPPSAIATTCPKGFVDAAASATSPLVLPDLCYTAPLPNAQAICICDSNSISQTPNPYSTAAASAVEVAAEEDDIAESVDVMLNGPSSAASRPAAALAPLLMALAASVLGSASVRRSPLLLVALSLLALCTVVPAPVAAHNFIKSLHRAQGASVTNPCIQRTSNQPHVQVVAKQDFEIEWSTGHGVPSTFYFAVLHESDFDQLRDVNVGNIIDEYLAAAPDSASLLKDAKYNKHHISKLGECALEGVTPNAKLNCNPLAYFNEGFGKLNTTDSLHIMREDAYKLKSHPTQYNVAESQLKQNTFLAKHLVRDARASYVNAKYPWIESGHRFSMVFAEHDAYVSQMDIARFYVDARKGPGDYIVYFQWSGYSDCVDVNVQPGTKAIAKRYGDASTSAAGSTLVRMDHCEWTYIPRAFSQAVVIGSDRDVSKCAKPCFDLYGVGLGCTGIQVTRAENLPGLISKPANIPWANYFNANDAQADPRCDFPSVLDRTEAGCNETLIPRAFNRLISRAQLAPRDDQYVCFGTVPIRNVDRQVEEDFRIFTDPTDPGWYSTCYVPTVAGGFIDLPPRPYKPPTWMQGDLCVDCDYYNSLFATNHTYAPDYAGKVSTNCRNCDLLRSKATPATLALVGAQQPNAGLPMANVWKVGPVSACSSAGTATRDVTCIIAATGKEQSANQCVASPKPATTVSCYTWQQQGSWSNCSAACGAGTQTAQQRCVQMSASTTTGALVADSMCKETKPATQRSCMIKLCVDPTRDNSAGEGGDIIHNNGDPADTANGGAAADSGSSSKSFIDTVGASTTYTALCIVALIFLAGVLAVGVVLLVRRRARDNTSAMLKHMAAEQTGSTELMANPAAATSSSHFDRL